MDDDLVVAGSFPGPIEAGLARDRLDDEGIRAFIMDSEVAAMAWHLTAAIGGVKLYVAQRDLERAHAVLDELERHVRHEGPQEDEPDPDDFLPDDAIRAGSPSAIREGRPPDEEPDEPEAKPTERELDAQRALYGAVGGLIVLPLQIYTLFLIFAVFGSEERLGPDYRRKLRWAVLINFPIMAVAGVGILMMMVMLFFG